jgi:hypothetical protein
MAGREGRSGRGRRRGGHRGWRDGGGTRRPSVGEAGGGYRGGHDRSRSELDGCPPGIRLDPIAQANAFTCFSIFTAWRPGIFDEEGIPCGVRIATVVGRGPNARPQRHDRVICTVDISTPEQGEIATRFMNMALQVVI